MGAVARTLVAPLVASTMSAPSLTVDSMAADQPLQGSIQFTSWGDAPQPEDATDHPAVPAGQSRRSGPDVTANSGSEGGPSPPK